MPRHPDDVRSRGQSRHPDARPRLPFLALLGHSPDHRSTAVGGACHWPASRLRPSLEKAYFVTRCLVGVTAVGAAGEIANVNHVLQPGARLAASKSPYALRPRKPCTSPSGKIYPICGPTPRTRDLKPPSIGF